MNHRQTDGPGRAGTSAPSSAAPALDVDALLDDPATRIVVCCGSGGVGKTTTAAALGVRAAERGRRTVVLTIDPARRLAQSMGLTELDNTPRRVPGVGGDGADAAEGSGDRADTGGGGGGELFAMMLDMKRTFDEIVEAHADPRRAQAILDNPFYQSLSAGFAGTQEYMAMEKLGQLKAADEWDLIVVDTPPSRSALDFLDAPDRLGSFLDGRFIKILTGPARMGGRSVMKFLDVGMSVVTGVLGKVLGARMLQDVQTFVAATESMFGGFRERADATYRLLQAPGTAFLVVAAPEKDALREASYFVDRLAEDRMPMAGLVLNRVHVTEAPRLTAERAVAAAETLEAEAGPVARLGPPADSDDDAGSSDSDSDSGAGSAPSHSVDKALANSDDLSPQGVKPTGDGHADLRTADAPGGATPDDGSPGYDAGLLAAGLLRLHAERMQVIARERRTRERFASIHPDVPVAEVAALPGDVHDLDGLRQIGERLSKSK